MYAPWPTVFISSASASGISIWNSYIALSMFVHLMTSQRLASSTAMTTSTASRLSRPRSSAKAAVGVSCNTTACQLRRELPAAFMRTFSSLAFSKPFRTSKIRAVICSLFRPAVAEYCARWRKLVRAERAAGAATTRVRAMLRTARRRKDMFDECRSVDRLRNRREKCDARWPVQLRSGSSRLAVRQISARLHLINLLISSLANFTPRIHLPPVHLGDFGACGGFMSRVGYLRLNMCHRPDILVDQ